MKTTRLFLIVAAITMLTTSCEAIIDSLSKNPVFEFAGATVYDGQKAFLGTTANCTIAWTNHDPEIVDLTFNERGKDCVATFILPTLSKKVTTVTISATNRDDESVDPFTGKITVVPWKIAVYKKGSDGKWKQIETVTTSSTTTFSYGASGNGAGTYKLQLEYLDKDNNYKAITSIPYRLGKLENHKVRWSGKLIGIDGASEKEDCSMEFVMGSSAPGTGQNLAAAYIGEVGFAVTVTK